MSRYHYSLYEGVSHIGVTLKSKLAAVSLGVSALAVGIALPLTTHAATNTTVTVTPTNFGTIFAAGTVRPESSFSFVKGPATPPMGVGSLALNTVNDNGKQQHLEAQQLGTPLSSISAMSYSTYRHADSTAPSYQAPAINMEVSTNGDGTGYTTLVFEPVYNTTQGTVQDETWQAWDAYSGGAARWWSSRDIPGLCAFSCYASWSDILAANPNATVLSYGVNQGGGNPGLHATVDALKIGVNGNNTTYDFEPYVVVADKEACKDNGWKTALDANGNSFKNQGACVSFVASNGKSQH